MWGQTLLYVCCKERSAKGAPTRDVCSRWVVSSVYKKIIPFPFRYHAECQVQVPVEEPRACGLNVKKVLSVLSGSKGNKKEGKQSNGAIRWKMEESEFFFFQLPCWMHSAVVCVCGGTCQIRRSGLDPELPSRCSEQPKWTTFVRLPLFSNIYEMNIRRRRMRRRSCRGCESLVSKSLSWGWGLYTLSNNSQSEPTSRVICSFGTGWEARTSGTGWRGKGGTHNLQNRNGLFGKFER